MKIGTQGEITEIKEKRKGQNYQHKPKLFYNPTLETPGTC